MTEDDMHLFCDTFEERNSVDPEDFARFDVKRGLRNADGTGVVAGITHISNVHGYLVNEGEKVPDKGALTFRGYDVEELITSIVDRGEFGFGVVCYLLLFGKIPTAAELKRLRELVDENRELPNGFTADVIMKFPSNNIMNMLERSVNVLYSFDPDAEAVTPEHEIATSISLLSRLPRIMVLAYHAKRAAYENQSMIMHRYVPGYSTAETILSMLRPDRSFTHEDAVMLDVMLMLHAEHGGGNNSTFVCRALTSAGTDPYSAYAGAIGSLKGSRHGGANLKVLGLHRELEQQVKDWGDEGQVADYLTKVVNKEAFDHSGLVYGMGHAVYTLSDPRAEICKRYASKLAAGTEFEEEFQLLQTIERVAPEVIAQAKGDTKKICANIDMYTGFVYKMLGVPEELITPIFACSRLAGWSAHRYEEIVSGKRIMRPAYKSTSHRRSVD